MIHAKSATSNGLRLASAKGNGASRRAAATRVHASSQEDAAAQMQRRALISSLPLAGALMTAAPSLAAYGEAANVFGGKTGNFTGFTPYEGDGYSVLLPSKWNPSNEKIFPGTDLRYEDNFDAVNNLEVIISKSGKSSITDSSTQEFLSSISFILGESATNSSFESKSEGGFKPNAIAAASVLTTDTKKVDGKTYYLYEILTRTADGNEGGRHHLISATVSKGNLYVFRIQAGDKRWFKGAKTEALGAWESFTVA